MFENIEHGFLKTMQHGHLNTSGYLKDFEEKENRPSWLQTSECLTRNTSKMSPVVLASSGS
jgi:hypothetical protein